MKVAAAAVPAAASPGPSCALKGVRLMGGGAGEAASRGLSEQSVAAALSRAGSPTPPSPLPAPRGALPLGGPEHASAAAAAAAASLLMDMKGCYSRLAALVPTLPRHRRVSKVEILQHVIDYIWDLQLELQHPRAARPDPTRGADETPAGAGPEASCVNPDDRILCR